MENEKEVITENTNPEGDGVTPAEGGKADENSTPVKAIKDVLGEALGKEFKSDEDALKSVKDTQDYVGTRKADTDKQVEEAVAKATDSTPDVAEEIRQLKEDNWFGKNSDYEGYRETITALQKPGQTLNEVVESSAFKGIYDKAKGFDENASSKSVLQSNPRLGKVKDSMTAAKTAASEGDYGKAGEDATKAVLDAYSLDK